MCVCVQVADILLTMRQDDEPASDFQDHTLVAVVAVAAHLMKATLGDSYGLPWLAERYHHDPQALDQVFWHILTRLSYYRELHVKLQQLADVSDMHAPVLHTHAHADRDDYNICNGPWQVYACFAMFWVRRIRMLSVGWHGQVCDIMWVECLLSCAQEMGGAALQSPMAGVAGADKRDALGPMSPAHQQQQPQQQVVVSEVDSFSVRLESILSTDMSQVSLACKGAHAHMHGCKCTQKC